MFIVFMALILVLASMTMNVGEVAKLKTTSANAADSGALAAASWVASGENELALIAQGMWINHLVVQAIFAIPFCWKACPAAGAIYAALILVNYTGLYEGAAVPVMKGAWQQAQAAALFTAVQNASIDDPSGQVQQQLKTLSDQVDDAIKNQNQLVVVTFPVTLSWTRKGAGEFPEASSVTINASFQSKPALDMSNWGPNAWCLSPCIKTPWFDCCWPAFPSWTSFQPKQPKVPPTPTAVSPGRPGWFLGGTWSSMVDSVASVFPSVEMGTCWFCVPIPMRFKGLTTPAAISHAEGDVTVTITQHREGGSSLGFWKMSYPDQIVSQATAHYSAATVDFWPDPKAKAQLKAILK